MTFEFWRQNLNFEIQKDLPPLGWPWLLENSMTHQVSQIVRVIESNCLLSFALATTSGLEHVEIRTVFEDHMLRDGGEIGSTKLCGDWSPAHIDWNEAIFGWINLALWDRRDIYSLENSDHFMNEKLLVWRQPLTFVVWVSGQTVYWVSRSPLLLD